MKNVILYSQTTCVPCQKVKRYLTNNGVEFEVRNIDESKKFWEEFTEMGYTSTPVTIIGEKHIVGFDLDELEEAIFE